MSTEGRSRELNSFLRFRLLLYKIVQMRTYEFVFIVRPTLTETQRKKLVDTVKSWLSTVKIVKEDEWGQKVLAYPVKRERSGFYFKFTLEGEGMPEGFDKRLTANEDILRYLIIRKK